MRKSKYAIEPLILHRWSPRAMTGEKLTEEEYMPLFEAARWAPSSYNGQPWRFLYAERETSDFDIFFDLLIEFNQSWCKNASLLVVVLSRKTFEHNGKPSITHSFDAGAAWQNLALQGSKQNLVVHGMQGFDYEKAKSSLSVPEEYAVEAMIAIGKKASTDTLSSELQQKEAPSDRKNLNEIICKGIFKK